MKLNRPSIPRSLEIIGADSNNLKNVDVTFPLNCISVVTGVSGSGKSSLLFNTLAAEGSKRMRIFLGQSQRELERDDVKAFIGPLPPTILVGQRGFRPSVRTTVGTATGFLSVLRRLFVLASVPYSEEAGEEVPPPSPESYSEWIGRHYRGEIEIWAAPARQQRTDGLEIIKRFVAQGIRTATIRSETDPPRFRESGRSVETFGFKGLNPNVPHTIEAFVGSVDLNAPRQAAQLREILGQAFAAGHNSVVITLPKAQNPDLAGPFGPRLDSLKHWVHPATSEVFFRPSSHLLSFNAPEHDESGACRACGGTGIGRTLDESALIPHPDRSMRKGAFALWTGKNYKYVNIQHETIEGLATVRGFSPDVPWSKLPDSARALVLDGSGDELIYDKEVNGRKFGKPRRFAGFRQIILDKSATGTKIADQLMPYVQSGACVACGGTRWSFQARALRVAGKGIAEILAMSFADVEVLAAPGRQFDANVPPSTHFLVESIRRHAHSIVSVGLGYLTGDRGMLAVSEGESRRIRLARVLDARETGLCLLLDEPGRGLHESDLVSLALSLNRLRGEHTVILNEHRERLWSVADWFVEIGPGAGPAGGTITHAGKDPVESTNENTSLRELLPVPSNHPKITIRGASIHNVQNVDCEIPIGRLTCISGVSGSGKSSFIRGILAPALLESLGSSAPDFSLRRGRWKSVGGIRSINEVVALDQTMPPPNRRSLVATFANVFDGVRKAFGSSPSARSDGLAATDFGVNAGHGRCQVCAGVGEIENDDLWSPCPSCGGSRFGHSVLSTRLDGINIQELLELPVEQLENRASAFSIPQHLITAMCDLGIGHLALGRRVDTLSGGEVQRLRLAMRLGQVSTGSTLFILDEPAVGLHPRDVRQLVKALDRVLDGGRNTVVMVEHDLRLIRSSDWILDFGPESGPRGGNIVFSGVVEKLVKSSTLTGLALADKLPTGARKPEAKNNDGSPEKAPLEAQLSRTTALIRSLINGEAVDTSQSEAGIVEPVVEISDRLWSDCDHWEVAGLSREIPKLLLDIQQTLKCIEIPQLLDSWRKTPDGWIAIQPFLTDMQVWEKEIPQSVIRSVASHISREGLRLVTDAGKVVGNQYDPASVRATGPRFVIEDGSDETRSRVIRDALAIGAGYVELRDQRGAIQAVASSRLLNLETAIVAPMTPVPSHFSRLDVRGRCPMCKGRRGVTTVGEALVIGSKALSPDNERFLAADANAVMKGVRHNELNPFLRRLAKEGLWNLKTGFDDLDLNERNLILFGFWSRPGPGSFLKTSQSNVGEVASWLRWDGLFRHVLEQMDRSRNNEWIRRVRESVRVKRCPRCEGSGLQRYANLLDVGNTPFPAWTRTPDPGDMLDLLKSVDVRSTRQRRTRDRTVQCLASFSGKTNAVTSIVKKAVELFTTMPAAEFSGTET